MYAAIHYPQGSVAFLSPSLEDVDKHYHFDSETMRLINLSAVYGVRDVENFFDYLILDSQWVHANDVDIGILQVNPLS